MQANNSLAAWLSSLRLKTLPLAISAIMLGNSLAYWQHAFDWRIFVLTLVTAVLLQILSNLANDYGDALKGSDQQRIGPKRGIHSGVISLAQLKQALIINGVLAILSGSLMLYLAHLSLTEIVIFLLLGFASIVAAITYTIGKHPYGYRGLGDVAVLIFFGLVAVLGSAYLQTRQLSYSLFAPAVACGLLAVSVLNINNLRDIDSDRASQKRTLVVMLGAKAGRVYHTLLLLMAYAAFATFAWLKLQAPFCWLFLVTIPLALQLLAKLWSSMRADNIVRLLGPSVLLALSTTLLFAFGVILNS